MYANAYSTHVSTARAHRIYILVVVLSTVEAILCVDLFAIFNSEIEIILVSSSLHNCGNSKTHKTN